MPPESIPESMREHRLELAEDPVTCLNLVEMAADSWGGIWQAEGRDSGRLGLPVMAGLRRGWVAGQLTVEPTEKGARLTYLIDKGEYKVQQAQAGLLFMAGLGAILTMVAPLAPTLWPLVPFALVMCVAAWLLVVSRLRNSGPEEFFEDLAEQAGEE